MRGGLLLPGFCALAVSLASVSSARAGARPADVILITVDTLRADALSLYGAPQSRTPETEALAAQAVVYTNAVTTAPVTRPAHTSLFTGLYPREHGVLDNGDTLAAGVPLFTERLAASGYQTAAFVGAALLGQRSGLRRGFATHEDPGELVTASADAIVARALGWLRGARPEAPVFLWVHLFDPHQPYDPPAGFREGLDPALARALPSLGWYQLDAIAQANGGDIARPILEHARRLYQREVDYVDAQLGVLFEGIRAARGLDSALVVLTADHGECFEQGIYFEHADCPYQGAMRVPLVIKYPGARWAGERRAEQVSLVDVAPTVLHELGLPALVRHSGRALQQRAEGRRYVLFQLPPPGRGELPHRLRTIRSVAGVPIAPRQSAEIIGLVGEGWKILRVGEETRLFALDGAAGERASLGDEHASTAVQLGVQLDAFLTAPAQRRERQALSAEEREALRSLGYVP